MRHRYEDAFSALALQSAAEIMGPDQKEWADTPPERTRQPASGHPTPRRRRPDGARARYGRLFGGSGNSAATWRRGARHSRSSGPPRGRRADPGPGQGAVGSGRPCVLAVRYGCGERAYVEGLAIERSQDDAAGLAEALDNLGFVRAVAGEHAEARTLYAEALEVASRTADQPAVLRYQEALAFLMFHMGEFAAARELQEQNVAAFKAAKETFRAAVGSGFLSYLEAKDGRYEIARAMQHEAFGVFRAADDKHWMVRELMLAAASAVIVGDLTLAAHLGGAYDVLREPLGEMATPSRPSTCRIRRSRPRKDWANTPLPTPTPRDGR